MFFTERRHSERSALGLTGSYETGRIDQAEVRTKCANSILVRFRTIRFLSSLLLKPKHLSWPLGFLRKWYIIFVRPVLSVNPPAFAALRLGSRITLPGSERWFCTVDLNLYGYKVLEHRDQRFRITHMKFNCSTRRDQKPQPKDEPTQEGQPTHDEVFAATATKFWFLICFPGVPIRRHTVESTLHVLPTGESTCFVPKNSEQEKTFLELVQIQNHLCALFSICTKPRNFFSRPDFFEGTKQVESIIPVFLKGEIRNFGCSLLFSGVPRPTIHG